MLKLYPKDRRRTVELKSIDRLLFCAIPRQKDVVTLMELEDHQNKFRELKLGDLT